MSLEQHKLLVRRFYEEHGGAANMLGPLLDIGAIRAVGPENE